MNASPTNIDTVCDLPAYISNGLISSVSPDDWLKICGLGGMPPGAQVRVSKVSSSVSTLTVSWDVPQSAFGESLWRQMLNHEAFLLQQLRVNNPSFDFSFTSESLVVFTSVTVMETLMTSLREMLERFVLSARFSRLSSLVLDAPRIAEEEIGGIISGSSRHYFSSDEVATGTRAYIDDDRFPGVWVVFEHAPDDPVREFELWRDSLITLHGENHPSKDLKVPVVVDGLSSKWWMTPAKDNPLYDKFGATEYPAVAADRLFRGKMGDDFW